METIPLVCDAFDRSWRTSKEIFQAWGIAVVFADDQIKSAASWRPNSTLGCPAAASVVELTRRQSITKVTVCTNEPLDNIPLIEWALLKAYGGENLTVDIVHPDNPQSRPTSYSINDLYPYPSQRSTAMPEGTPKYLTINNDELTILHHPLLDPPDAAEPSTVRRALGLWMQTYDNCDGIKDIGGLLLEDISGADWQALKRMCPHASINGKTVAEWTRHLYASDNDPSNPQAVSEAWGHTLPPTTESWVEKAEDLLRKVMATIPQEKKAHLRLAVVTNGEKYCIVSNDPDSAPPGYWTCAERKALELWTSIYPDTVTDPLMLVHSVHDANGDGMIGPQACPCGSCAEAIGHRLLTVVGTDLKKGRQVFSNTKDHTLTLVPDNIPSRPLARERIKIHCADGTTHESYALHTEHVDCSHPPPLAWPVVPWEDDNVLVSSRLAPLLGLSVSPITGITLNTKQPSILTLEASRRQHPGAPPIPILTITGSQLPRPV
ncbi:MAG: hypothetical protein ACK5O1_02325 [Holosporales bacterium]|jgi:hypothetical protein